MVEGLPVVMPQACRGADIDAVGVVQSPLLTEQRIIGVDGRHVECGVSLGVDDPGIGLEPPQRGARSAFGSSTTQLGPFGNDSTTCPPTALRSAAIADGGASEAKRTRRLSAASARGMVSGT